MTGIQAMASNFLAMWNEPDRRRRNTLVTAGGASDCRFVNLLMDAHAHERIGTMVKGARAQFASHGLMLRERFDDHGHFVRFSWSPGLAGGGTDAAHVDAGARLTVTGLLDGSIARG